MYRCYSEPFLANSSSSFPKDEEGTRMMAKRRDPRQEERMYAMVSLHCESFHDDDDDDDDDNESNVVQFHSRRVANANTMHSFIAVQNRARGFKRARHAGIGN
ncbi:unnamed protein product [Lasius platythorax]|uniref:Uncharacterized protein n=1 Tax=Lasius platythorax TaxID=488582 RepID=A0AAV2NJF0_9HYME